MADTQRIVIVLPDDVYEDFKVACEREYKTMSAVGRELIIEWIKKRKEVTEDTPEE